MAYFTLILDTIGPASPTIDLGGSFTANQLINVSLGTSDSNTNGYQVKLWGDIDVAWAKANQILPSGSEATEVTQENALWVAFSTSKQIKLSSADGLKNVYAIIRDDVHNESAQVSDSISLDATLPEVTIVNGGADVEKISANTDKNTANFSFYADEDFVEYKVCFVTSAGATHEQGTVIGTANGSENTSGTGDFKADTNYNVVLKGADIQAISSSSNPQGDPKGIKVFVKDLSGHWSA